MDWTQFTFQMFAILVESVAFCIIFRIRGINIVLASIGAVCGTAVFLILSSLFVSYYLSYMAAGFIISAYGEVMARVRKTPVTVFLVIAIFPLVPGSNAYYMMEYCILQQFRLAAYQAVRMVAIAGSIALGLFVAASIMRFIPYIYPKRKLNADK